jgi:hypothetical protein
MTTTARVCAAFLVLVGVSFSAPAWSQSAATPAAPVQTSKSIAQQQPGKRPPSVRQQPTPGFSQLTAGECKRLGGQVYTAPNCSVTGTRCVMKLSGGDIRAPCIDEVE